MMARLRESRWVYVLLSILLAIIFWAYIRAAVDPNGTTQIHNVRVETTGTNILTSQGLTISDISPQVVELHVEGPNSARTRLIHGRNNLSVVVDVSRCVEGENVLRYKPSWPDNVNQEEVFLQDQEPPTITVTVEKLYTRTFDVEFQLNGKVDGKFQMGTPAIEPEQVIVSGPVEQVNQVARVAAILEDSKVDLKVDIKSGGGATVEDATVKIEPDALVVSGLEADLDGLEEIYLGSISLSDVVGTKTVSFPINLDPRFTNESGLTTANVTVNVEGLDTEVFAVSNIRTIHPEGYNVDVVTQSVLVTVRGPKEDLDNIDASQILVVADLSNMTAEGSRQVAARVYLNSTSTVGVIGEYTILVNMSR